MPTLRLAGVTTLVVVLVVVVLSSQPAAGRAGSSAWTSSTAPSSSTCSVPSTPHTRLSCGGYAKWDTEELCTARGCCWNPSVLTAAWCHYPAPAARERVRKVHVVQGAHLDVGFADTAPAIVNRWFGFFAAAVQTGEALARNSSDPGRQLKFTAQSWLVSLYLSCPPDLGLNCPSAAEVAAFTAGVQAGYVTWHAFPFNGEAEFLASPALFAQALDLTHGLDAHFGQPNKTVLSQRDVPGMTRSVLPLLASRGIRAISVGVNGGSTPPDVPQMFMWRDPASGAQLPTMYLTGGYGGVSIIKGVFVATLAPGWDEALVVDWRGDNAGPPAPEEVVQHHAQLQAEFPGAEIVVSTFDEYVAALLASNATAQLPVVEAEIGDSWVHGVQSDPLKVAQERAAERELAVCLAEGACSFSERRVANFSRLLLKNMEHTWGGDHKLALAPKSFLRSNWGNADFHRLQYNDSRYAALTASWVRQRRWGLDVPLQALEDHPLAARLAAAWSEIRRHDSIDVRNCTFWDPQGNLSSANFSAHGLQLVLDGGSSGGGGVQRLVQLDSGRVWASAAGSGGFGQPVYRTYSAENFTRFMADYNYLSLLFPLDDLDDFDKVGIAAGGARYRTLQPPLQRVWSQPLSNGDLRVVAEMVFPAEVVANAGAPARALMEWRIVGPAQINATVVWLNKTATRLPEALSLRFQPESTGAIGYSLRKLGSAVNASDNVLGAGQHTHGADQIDMCRAGGGDGNCLRVQMHDFALVRAGQPDPMPAPTRAMPDLAGAGVSLLAYDNWWNTNYISYFPFQPEEATFRQRFELVIA